MPRAGKNPSCWGQRELCKGPRGICPRQKSQLLSLGCPLPSPPPPAAIWDAEGGSWLWAAVPDGSGPPAPVKVPRGDKGSLWIWGGKGKALVAGPGTPPSPAPSPAPFTALPLLPPTRISPLPPWLENTPSLAGNPHAKAERGKQPKNNPKEPAKLPCRPPSASSCRNSPLGSLQEPGSAQLEPKQGALYPALLGMLQKG